MKTKKLLLSFSIFASLVLAGCSSNPPAHVHEVAYTEESVRIEATCEQDGLKDIYSYCSCGKHFKTTKETIPAYGHNYVAYDSNNQEPTCSHHGVADSMICTYCHNIIYDYVDPTPHHYRPETTIVNRVEATCSTKGGYDIVQYCEYCEKVEVVEHVTIEPFGHDMVHSSEIDVECGDIHGHVEGEVCSRCGLSTYLYTGFGEHNLVYSRETVTTSPGCTTMGEKNIYGICTHCNQEYLMGKELIACTGHHYDYHERVEPTCTQNGCTEYLHCSDCGHTEGKETLYRYGHNLGDPVYDYSSSYNYVYEEYYCQECGLLIKKEEHMYGSGGVKISKGIIEACTDSKIAFSVTPSDTVVAKSSNDSVAEYKSGYIYTKNTGTCLILFNAPNYSTTYLKVIVNAPYFSFTVEDVYVGNTSMISVSTNLDCDFLFIAGNETTAAVNDLVVTGVNEGTTGITGYAVGTDLSYYVKINVLANKIIVKATSVVCFTGSTLNLTEYFTSTVPDKFAYTSSNASVATINSGGVISGLKNGTSIITISGEKCGNATISVTVREKVTNYITVTSSNIRSYFDFDSIFTSTYYRITMTIKSGYEVYSAVSVECHLTSGVVSWGNTYLRIEKGGRTDYAYDNRNNYSGAYFTFGEVSGTLVYYS